MLAKDMCSKNPEVGHLIRPIHNKSLFDSENFSSFAKFAFQNKRPLLQHSFRLSDGSTLPDRLSLKADPPTSVNFNPSFKYS